MLISELECLLALKRKEHGDVEVVVNQYEQLAECNPILEVTLKGEECLDTTIKAPHTYVSIGCWDIVR